MCIFNITLKTRESRRYTVEMYASAIDFDLWPLTLKTFSSVPTHMTNVSGKFHWNPSTKYRDMAVCEIVVNGRPNRRRESIMPSPHTVGGDTTVSQALTLTPTPLLEYVTNL